ncbi:bifunctional 2-polyprenyl-6-hydroxyphenol methylase/3-demethylubiquinol 3-O-methyltransferase UbiG [Litoreibacter roseus]|uniref:bifunctional 2-polyprenyl-6-hydroxyphenol methylase/3-demethylubiquinol 3-O-methyltransferase UbiG n=1 Tax=Litoreibacter roseus TaxID=2601869 RepID=UPI001FA99B01|nr:bifunctional 2-polyprenyl-6-hydroxyphenol methylase/3-demethylubiquinol 3-O-methyltransferase UbiG [Litoreibacter roseus]
MADGTRNNLAIYDDVAADWWSDDIRWVRTLKNMVPARLKYFEKTVSWADKDILDVGCAGGFVAEELSKRGGRVIGIDPAADAIEAAKQHAAQNALEISYDVGIGEELPYENNSFDHVVCVDVLEHVQSVPQVLAEIARVLRPDGYFLFDTINRNPIARFATITIAEDVLGLLPKGTHDPAMFIKPDELRGKLVAAGFSPDPFKGLGLVGLNKRGDFVFGQVPLKAVIYMGVAQLTNTHD